MMIDAIDRTREEDERKAEGGAEARERDSNVRGNKLDEVMVKK